MPHTRCEFAIAGSNPLAALIAISLSGALGKSVCLVATPPHPLQVMRGIDLSLAPATRPESWALLHAGRTETERLLADRDPGFTSRTSIALIGRGDAAATALGHMRHMAAGFGELTEPLAADQAQRLGAGFVVRDATRLRRRPFFAGLGGWLMSLNIPLLPLERTGIVQKRDHVLLSQDGHTLAADRLIVADADAAFAVFSPDVLSKRFETVRRSALLSEPGGTLSWPALCDISRDGVAHAQPDGRLETVVLGSRETGRAVLQSLMTPDARTLLAGQTEFLDLASRDGAPVVGPLNGSRAEAALGFGQYGAFLATALARYFAGDASPEETGYFAARAADRTRGPVAEFRARTESEAA